MVAGIASERSSTGEGFTLLGTPARQSPAQGQGKSPSLSVWCARCAVGCLVQMSAMEVDSTVDAGVEEQKGEGKEMPSAAGAAERTQKGKGEGDRNVMLHPVRMLCCTLVFSVTVTG